MGGHIETTTIDVCKELDKLHKEKQELTMRLNATINIAEAIIAKSLKLKKEIEVLNNKHNGTSKV